MTTTRKPAKPYPDYPLFAHANGRWAKKIGGKTYYFGKWDDPAAALAKFQKDFPRLSGVQQSGETTDCPPKPERPPSKASLLKPYDGFPLYPHATKRWCKKILGKIHYFGPLNDWEAALKRYNYEMPFLSQGLIPPPQDKDALVTVEEMCNLFLAHCDSRVASGELAARSFSDYRRVSKVMIQVLGADCAVEHIGKEHLGKLREYMANKYNLVSLGNEIARCRVIFNYAYRDGLIAAPVRMGSSFARPSAKSIRIAKASQPPKIFTIEELTSIYAHATPVLRAFMLLALNGGMGNSDIGQLQHRHIQNGWVDFPRPKTGIARRFPLWPETLAAIEQCSSQGQGDDLLFLTKYRESWHKADSGTTDCPIAKEFRKICIAAKCHQKGRGFYALRHQFRTIADSACDRVAIDTIMGHADYSMGAVYREWVDPERLQKVVNHVRQWVAPMWQ